MRQYRAPCCSQREKTETRVARLFQLRGMDNSPGLQFQELEADPVVIHPGLLAFSPLRLLRALSSDHLSFPKTIHFLESPFRHLP
jgi:hypothetical protein